MTTYNTGNPIGSTDPKDLYDNAEALDRAINDSASTFTDRLGNERPTLKRLETDYPLAGVYADEAAISAENAQLAQTGAVAAQASAVSAQLAAEAARDSARAYMTPPVWHDITGVAAGFVIDINAGEFIGYTQTAGSVDVAKDVNSRGQNLTPSGGKAPLAALGSAKGMQFDGATTAYYSATLADTLITGDNKPAAFMLDMKQTAAQSVNQTLFTMYSAATPANFLRVDASSNNISVQIQSGIGVAASIGGSTDYGQSIGNPALLGAYFRPGTNAETVFWNNGYVSKRGGVGITGSTSYAIDRVALGGLTAGTNKSKAIQSALAIKSDASLTAQGVASSMRQFIRSRRPDLEKVSIGIVAMGQSNAHGPAASGADLVTFADDEAFFKDLNAAGTEVFDRTAVGSSNFGGKAYVALYFAKRLQEKTALMGVNGGKGIVPVFFNAALGGTAWMGKNAVSGEYYLTATDPNAVAGSSSYWNFRQAAIGGYQTLKNLSANLRIVKTVGVLSGFEADTQLASGQVAGDIRTPQAEIEASLERFMNVNFGAGIAGIDQILLTEVGTRGLTQADVEGQEASIAAANAAFSALESRLPSQFMKVFSYSGRYGTAPFSLSNLQLESDGSYISGTELIDEIHRSVRFQKAVGYSAADKFIAKGGLDGLI